MPSIIQSTTSAKSGTISVGRRGFLLLGASVATLSVLPRFHGDYNPARISAPGLLGDEAVAISALEGDGVPPAPLTGLQGNAIAAAPTLESILAKAGPQSAHYDLRDTETLFQPADVTVPGFDPEADLVRVTASGQSLGVVLDQLHGFFEGNHLVSAVDAAPEYWIDPLTGEPCSWYDTATPTPLSWAPLLGPGCQGAVGTLCIAYTTGAQVFDLNAGAALPPGPMIACYFFDFVLSDAEAAVMKATMDAIVADDSWMGYVIADSYVDYICPVDAGVQVHFSADPTHDSNNWPDLDGLGCVIALSSARQRFRITIANSFAFTPGNAIPGIGEAYIVDGAGNALWIPEVADTLSPSVNGWAISVAPLAGSTSPRYGALNVLLRSPSVPVAQVQYQSGLTPTGYDLRVQPLTRQWVATSALVRFYAYQTNELFPAGPAPNLSAATSLNDLLLNGVGFTGELPPCHATLRTYNVTGFVDAQPCPLFALSVKSITMDYCNLTTMIDLIGLSGVTNISINQSRMPGVLPSLTLATSGIDPAVNAFRILLTGNAITSYAGGVIAPDHRPGQFDVGGSQVRVNQNALDQASVDALIQACVDSGIVEGVGGGANRLYLQDGTTAHPSGAGMIGKGTLEVRGWQVAINP